jgi:mono/diheme cytochrome c family protein
MKIMIALLLSAGFALLMMPPGWAEKGSQAATWPSEQVTFTKDVAPIFYQHCAACHRPGEIAPMSLLNYKETRPWAKAIREKVATRQMPPWHADPAYGQFKNDRRLSPKEIDTIVAWVDGGAKEGHPKDLPPPPQFTEGWQIGKPDAVLQMPREFHVPATGVVDYQYIVIPTNFTEDRWVQAVEIRPGNRAVVHHVIAFLTGPETQFGWGRAGGRGVEGRMDSLGGTAPGEQPVVFPAGVARLLKAGSHIVLQMHYTPNGTATTDRTSVGLIFSQGPPQKPMSGSAAINALFLIPPGAESHEVRASYTFREDVHLISLMPHMHLRGKDFQYRLVYPDGSSKIILSVPRYDFNWQTRYELTEALPVPKGSRLECVAHFDNSAKNKWNPDPTKMIHWGQQTWDEMMVGFIGFTRDSQEVRKDSPSIAK